MITHTAQIENGTVYNSEEEWESYKKTLKKNYHQEPYSEPDKFPCLSIIAETFISNPNGPDFKIHSFFYDFKENS